MKFYTEVAHYYDEIFPVNQTQVTFFQKRLKVPPKKILDLACGTGTLLSILCSRGYHGLGIDLNEEMIKIAKQKGNHNCEFCVSDMLTFKEGKYDLISCIGNSLVHLIKIDDIRTFLTNCKDMLKDNGTLVIQIINYNRILKYNIKSLPIISNDAHDLTFIREYTYDKNNNLILFTTTLKVEEVTLTNSVKLYPLKSEELVMLLAETGYHNIKLYGDFHETPYDPDTSYSLVVEASGK